MTTEGGRYYAAVDDRPAMTVYPLLPDAVDADEFDEIFLTGRKVDGPGELAARLVECATRVFVAGSETSRTRKLSTLANGTWIEINVSASTIASAQDGEADLLEFADLSATESVPRILRGVRSVNRAVRNKLQSVQDLLFELPDATKEIEETLARESLIYPLAL